MRRWLSIAKATALEMLSEPLSLLLLLAALAISTLAPAFHYHQFGEPTRIARDAGFSALFTCGTAFAVFLTLRAFRREIETGTAQMALSHPISRAGFFISKTLGAGAAYAIFALIVAANALTVTRGAELGAELAEQSGDIAKLWGPSFAIGIATAIWPLALAAALNRFLHFRFVLTALVTALVTALAGAAYRFSPALALRLWPVALLIAMPTMALLAATAAASVRLKTNAAATAAGVIFAAMLPAVGNYYLPDALSNGGCLSWGYVALAAAAMAPATAAFVILGISFFNGRDIA